MPALGIADTNNLFGALEFSEKLAKSGVQPIISAQTTIDFADAAPAFLRVVERDNARAPIVLLAQSEIGYRNLMRLVSGLWLDPTDGDEPHIPFAAGRKPWPDRADRRSGRTDRAGAEKRDLPTSPRAVSGASARSSARVFMSRSSATDSTPSGRSSRRLSVSPIALVFRWSRPTSPISHTPPTTRPMTRCCASPRGPWCRLRTAGACRPSIGSRPGPRWSSSSPTFPKRPRRASRSRCAAPIGR